MTSEGFEPTITPMLSVKDAAAAVEFYKSAFGATELTRLTSPTGAVLADLSIRGATFMVADESREHGNLSPQSLDGTSVRISLVVPDADAVASRAVAAGATVIFPVADQDYGFRQGRLADPFGHQWVIGTPLEEAARS